jgi:hypothetical protein
MAVEEPAELSLALLGPHPIPLPAGEGVKGASMKGSALILATRLREGEEG